MRSRAPFLTAIWILVLSSPFAVPMWLWVQHSNLGTMIALAFAVSISSRLGLIFKNWRRRILQSRIRSLAWKEHKPLVLISRSFEQSKHFFTNLSIPEAGIFENGISLIGALIYDLSHKHPIVVLSDKDLDRDGPANDALYVKAWEPLQKDSSIWVASDDLATDVIRWTASWENIFVDLAIVARYILLIPALSDGFLREVALLKAGKLGRKTIVYIWPQPGAIPNSPVCASPNVWEALRAPLAAHGLTLPAHRPEGALLRFDAEFVVAREFEPITGKNIFTPLNADINDAPPLRRIAPLIASYEITARPATYRPMWGFFGD